MGLGMASRARCAAVWSGATIAAAVLVGALVPPLVEATGVASRGDLGAAGFESLLVWGCAAAAAAVTGWLWLVATLVTLDAARGLPTCRRGVPVGLQRALLALCGVALTSGLAAPALATGWASTGPGPTTQVLAGLRLPERVAVSPSARATGVARPVMVPATPEATVVVGPGDTLWAIAARQLGPQAGDEETAAAWPAIYALNRDLIGPDPGLLEPGQRLVLPPALSVGTAR